MSGQSWRTRLTRTGALLAAGGALVATVLAGVTSAKTADAATTTIVGMSQNWRYLDGGYRPDSGWKYAGFDDSTWKVGPGPLGYGDSQPALRTYVSWGPDQTAKNITTYYRRSFSIDNAAAYAGYSIEVRRDDGVIVYVNGQEVLRDNMPSGAIDPSNWANVSQSAPDQLIELTLPSGVIKSGTNVVSAELHQASTSDDDAAFGLRLLGNATAASGARLVAVGDIGVCGGYWPSRVASIVRNAGGRFAMLGDAAYPNGSATDYQNCYDPAFRDLKSRTSPVPGNHDYLTSTAAAYRQYFGARAAPSGTTWYSYDLGGWHIVALDTECGSNSGCGVGSAQYRWLAADLAAHPNRCLAVTAHRPLWASGTEENDPSRYGALTDLIFAHGGDLWLSGHAHNYERFGHLDRGGHENASGIRAFVVGTGGGGMYAFNTVAHGSRVRNNTSWGALVLDLTPGGYRWKFENATSNGFTDSGSDTC